MIRIISLSYLILFLCSCNATKTVTPTKSITQVAIQKPNAPKNIILLIGDGMGMGQISAGTYMNDNTSALERFPIVGLHKPHCSDSLITDSAAAATSFASGIKTYYNAIGVDTDSLPVPTILEEAESKSMVTGLVATSTIVHATPAAFYAHNKSRRNYEEIAVDLVDSGVDYFVGGGNKFFTRRESDERNLAYELKEKGYAIGNYLSDFTQFFETNKERKKIGFLTADKDPLPQLQGRDYLENSSLRGIEFLDGLSSENGFFLMIEGSQIDWGGHANNPEYIVSEFIEFSNLIHKVLDWAENDGNTLVVVTADHETGGFTIQPGSEMGNLKTAFTSKKHSGDFIPVFAYGPGSELFSGLYENTAIYHKMRKALDWK